MKAEWLQEARLAINKGRGRLLKAFTSQIHPTNGDIPPPHTKPYNQSADPYIEEMIQDDSGKKPSETIVKVPKAPNFDGFSTSAPSDYIDTMVNPSELNSKVEAEESKKEPKSLIQYGYLSRIALSLLRLPDAILGSNGVGDDFHELYRANRNANSSALAKDLNRGLHDYLGDGVLHAIASFFHYRPKDYRPKGGK